MPSLKKQLILNLICGIISSVSIFIINFFMTPYISEKLGLDSYGFIALANNIINYINIVSVAVNSFSARYIAINYHAGKIDEANNFYSSILAANIILAVIITVPFSVIIAYLDKFINISENLVADVKILFILILLNYFIGLINGVYNSVLFIKNKLDTSSWLRCASYIIYTALLLGLVYFSCIKVYYLALSNLIAGVFLIFFNIYYSKKLAPELKTSIYFFSWYKIKELFSAGVFNSINYLGGTLGSGLDLLVTNLYLSNTTMGQIAICEECGGILNKLISLSTNIFQPKILEAYSKNEKERLIRYFRFSMDVGGSIGNVICFCFLFLGKAFFKLWLPGQDYDFFFNISIIVILGNVFISVVSPLWYVYTLVANMKMVAATTIVCGFCNIISMLILLNISAFNKHGAYIVVGTTTVLNLVSVFQTPYLSKKYLNLERCPFIINIIKHFLITGSFLVLYLFTNFNINITSWPLLILCGGCAVFVSGVSCLFLQFGNENRFLIFKSIPVIKNII